MTISEYGCDACGYAYQGCGGLGVLESGEGKQTVSCTACEALHDVPLGVNLRELTRNCRRTLESVLATLTFACPIDASHDVRPWTDGEAGMAVSGAIVSICPVCEGHVSVLRAIREMD